MFKIRAGIAVILATIIGIVLVIVALRSAQDAMQIRSISREDLFIISGNALFSERSDDHLWNPRKHILVTLRDYPASFIIAGKTAGLTAASFNKAMDTTARIAIPKSALGLLQTRSEIKLYELSTGKGKVIYPFDTAVERDKAERLRLYLQAGLCFLAGLVLLIVPKRYLVKQ